MTRSHHRTFKDNLYAEFARIGKALASRQRLEFLDLLAQAEWSVDALATETQESVANTSRHLQILLHARLVETRREGTTIYYRLADPTVLALWRALRETGTRRLSEVERLVDTYLHERKSLEAVDCRTLAARMQEGNLLVLDVRPRAEYEAGHIAGARSFPLPDLEEHLADLARECDIVAYCRGPYCVMADEAVALLRARGMRAQRLDGGLPDWRAQGLPIERQTQP